MGREVSEEAPSAPESASTSTATTEVFHSLRRSLIAKFGKRGEVDAFQHLCDLVNVGVERRTMRSVLEAVRQVGSSLARYRQLVAAGRHVFVSQPSPAYLRSIGQQRGSAQAG